MNINSDIDNMINNALRFKLLEDIDKVKKLFFKEIVLFLIMETFHAKAGHFNASLFLKFFNDCKNKSPI